MNDVILAHNRPDKCDTTRHLLEMNHQEGALNWRLSLMSLTATYKHYKFEYYWQWLLTNNDQSKSGTRQCNVHLMMVNDEAHVTLAPANRRSSLDLILRF